MLRSAKASIAMLWEMDRLPRKHAPVPLNSGDIQGAGAEKSVAVALRRILRYEAMC